jgi:hypothetical protein
MDERLRRWGIVLIGVSVWLLAVTALPLRAAPDDDPVTFILAGDHRQYDGPGYYDQCGYFRGVVEAAHAVGPGAFMVLTGDVEPLADLAWTLTKTLGSDYAWFSAVGNHELPGAGQESEPGENLAWLRTHTGGAHGPGALPDLISRGPAGCPDTTYSFEHGSVHVAVLNLYCDATGAAATDGDVSDALYAWLAADLAATEKPHVFVVGHEPAYPQPDAHSGRLRHLGDSLDQHPAHRDRFWSLLAAEGVTAYVCGHTHGYSATRIDGVWQIDVGHSAGMGDSGARSTFVRVTADAAGVTYETYRSTHERPCDYRLTQRWEGAGPVETLELRDFNAAATPLGIWLWALGSGGLGIAALAVVGRQAASRRRMR